MTDVVICLPEWPNNKPPKSVIESLGASETKNWMSKSNINTMLIFTLIWKEVFVPSVQTVNQALCLQILVCLQQVGRWNLWLNKWILHHEQFAFSHTLAKVSFGQKTNIRAGISTILATFESEIFREMWQQYQNCYQKMRCCNVGAKKACILKVTTLTNREWKYRHCKHQTFSWWTGVSRDAKKIVCLCVICCGFMCS